MQLPATLNKGIWDKLKRNLTSIDRYSGLVFRRMWLPLE